MGVVGGGVGVHNQLIRSSFLNYRTIIYIHLSLHMHGLIYKLNFVVLWRRMIKYVKTVEMINILEF